MKQGDPLSPTLFIIAVKVLPRGMNDLHKDTEFIGFGLSKWSEQINQLSYIDDTILLCFGHEKLIKKKIRVLRRFEEVSGQLINLNKSFLYLHEKTPIAVGQRLTRITGIG